MTPTTLPEDQKMPPAPIVLDSEIEDLETRVAPGVDRNHNETLVRDSGN